MMRSDIKALVKEVRVELERTQEQMAENLCISPRYYQQLESGWAAPSLSLALDIADQGGSVELVRNGRRYVIQALRPDTEAIHLNRIDRSACAVLMKLAEELSEGSAAISRDLMTYINRIKDQGVHTEALAAMYEQAIPDVRTALALAEEWFLNHRPDVAVAGEERHRRKVWERGYVEVVNAEDEAA